VREVPVHGERFADPQLLHDHEADSVHEAVVLVLVPYQIFEGFALFFGAHLVQPRRGGSCRGGSLAGLAVEAGVVVLGNVRRRALEDPDQAIDGLPARGIVGIAWRPGGNHHVDLVTAPSTPAPAVKW